MKTQDIAEAVPVDGAMLEVTAGTGFSFRAGISTRGLGMVAALVTGVLISSAAIVAAARWRSSSASEPVPSKR